jgi:translation initiation factor 4G
MKIGRRSNSDRWFVMQESTLAEGVDTTTPPDKPVQEKEQALLERYKLVLQSFLHEKVDLQVVAVYALQVFCHALQFPKGEPL